MVEIMLPGLDGRQEAYRVPMPGKFDTATAGASLPRIALSAAHVVADPLGDPQGCDIDWHATIAYRHRLWDLGLGIAEGMDTAQRGMGLNWTKASELIRQTLAEAKGRPDAVVFSGVGTDHLPDQASTQDAVIAAYSEQLETVQAAGGRVILMASRALARTARTPEDYAAVYGKLLKEMDRPAILHWLGPMFDPSLQGYWGHDDFKPAMEACLDVISENASSIDGIKISLLDKDLEIEMRRRLPADVRMYTGDDFNYAELIEGDGDAHSHALLGIFDPIAPAASAALAALGRGETQSFRDILAPTVPLSRRIFDEPTRFYKTGVVLLAYLNGYQNHFVMLGGQQSARSLPHLADVFRLAGNAGLLNDPERAVWRMRKVLGLG